MMRTALLCIILTALSVLPGYAQNDTIGWINHHAHPLNPDTALFLDDLAFLSSTLKGNTVLGLGEASHGTKEFYNQKKRIIEYLTTRLKYRNLGFELSDSIAESINQHVLHGKGDLKELMKNMHLYNTREVYGVFQFIKHLNKQQKELDKVRIFGFDRADFAHDPLSRDKYMANIIMQNSKDHPGKTIIWAHNVHIAKDTTMARWKAMGYFLKEHFGKKYYALGFDTFKGSVNVINGRNFLKHDFETTQNSYSKLFAKAKYENFFISFRKKSNLFWGTRNNITNIYSNWTAVRTLPVKTGVDFDAIIFLKQTTASVELR